jgi:hypothetical protein
MSEVVELQQSGPPAGSTRTAARMPILIGAIIIGLVAIMLVRLYKRPDPPKDSPAPGMTVGSDAITLSDSAPMWSVVKVAAAKPSEPHWTDAVPARIVFDEARTSRLRSPAASPRPTSSAARR